ncbi:MAG: hypothetical protein ACHQ1D_00015 [Nitrososphaerales archaeon]
MSNTTKIKSASVKVMLSYNYCHFESSMSLENDEGVSLKEIDEARKNCQRLSDKAIEQYKKHAEQIAKRTNSNYDKEKFESDCKKIKCKCEQDRTIKEIAMLKTYENDQWQKQFDYDYDYEDDDNYDPSNR